MYAKSSAQTLPLLNRSIEIAGPDGVERAYVQAACDEYLEVIILSNYDEGEFYAELYFDCYGEDGWQLVRILD